MKFLYQLKLESKAAKTEKKSPQASRAVTAQVFMTVALIYGPQSVATRRPAGRQRPLSHVDEPSQLRTLARP